VSGVLDTLVRARRSAIAEAYGSLGPADCERLACCARPVRDFAAALQERMDVALVAEVKKASPSAGPIAPDCEASKQALHYQGGGAAAVSVLCEPEFFGGSLTDLSDVADAVDVPVLCKDVIVDPVQLFLARGHGADAVLLMVSVLGGEVAEYLDLAATLGMVGMVEVIDEDELETARDAGARLIDVNSRDLHTLGVDRNRAHAVVTQAKTFGLTVVAASGIRGRGDVEEAAEAGADGVLVGETLMRAQFPEDVLEELTGVRRRVRGNV
jgi:indole-3-glycerol phosphate synthase